MFSLYFPEGGEKRWPARLHGSGPNEAILTGWDAFLFTPTKRSGVARKMTPEQVAEAQGRALEWKKKWAL
jgi:hypothetical protein